MSLYKAFLFDMNGTMIDDMHFHERAWYNILAHELNAGPYAAGSKAADVWQE